MDWMIVRGRGAANFVRDLVHAARALAAWQRERDAVAAMYRLDVGGRSDSAGRGRDRRGEPS